MDFVAEAEIGAWPSGLELSTIRRPGSSGKLAGNTRLFIGQIQLECLPRPDRVSR
jgi:hypothetical protein